MHIIFCKLYQITNKDRDRIQKLRSKYLFAMVVGSGLAVGIATRVVTVASVTAGMVTAAAVIAGIIAATAVTARVVTAAPVAARVVTAAAVIAGIVSSLRHAEADGDKEDEHKGQTHAELHVFTSALGLDQVATAWAAAAVIA